MRVGFIGLGRMGRAMSESLAKAGHELILCDAQPETAAALAKASGASHAATPAEIAQPLEWLERVDGGHAAAS